MLRASDYQDRFHDFSRRAKTVETVPNFFLLFCTRLKPGVNENKAMHRRFAGDMPAATGVLHGVWCSKRKAKAEMKRAEIFVLVRIGIDSVIETNRADRQLIAQAPAYGVAHIA